MLTKTCYNSMIIKFIDLTKQQKFNCRKFTKVTKEIKSVLLQIHFYICDVCLTNFFVLFGVVCIGNKSTSIYIIIKWDKPFFIIKEISSLFLKNQFLLSLELCLKGFSNIFYLMRFQRLRFTFTLFIF